MVCELRAAASWFLVFSKAISCAASTSRLWKCSELLAWCVLIRLGVCILHNFVERSDELGILRERALHPLCCTQELLVLAFHCWIHHIEQHVEMSWVILQAALWGNAAAKLILLGRECWFSGHGVWTVLRHCHTCCYDNVSFEPRM